METPGITNTTTTTTSSAAARLDGKGMDLDPSRRPGSPHEREPRPLENAIWPVARQESHVRVFMHGRPNKTFPPVFGTAVPPKGLSGQIKALAYSRPDHETVHWLLMLLSDRVDVWEHRLKKVAPIALVGGLLYVAGAAWMRRERTPARRARGRIRRAVRLIRAR